MCRLGRPVTTAICRAARPSATQAGLADNTQQSSAARTASCATGAVALTVFDLDPPAVRRQHLATLLDEAERRRATSFKFEIDRRRYEIAHGRLRDVLARRLASNPNALRFRTDDLGKPRIVHPPAVIDFSLSHAGALGLIGIAEGFEVGVDLEPLRPLDDLTGLEEQVFSDEERRLSRDRSERERRDGFLRVWTRKEAVLKACGLGLSLAPSTFTVGLERTRLRAPDGRVMWLRSFVPATGYIAAVCATKPFDCSLHFADD